MTFLINLNLKPANVRHRYWIGSTYIGETSNLIWFLKYKQICTFLVPGLILSQMKIPPMIRIKECSSRKFRSQEDEKFCYFLARKDNLFNLRTGKKEDKDAKFSFNEVELHLWYLMYSLFAIKKNYWNTVGSF